MKKIRALQFLVYLTFGLFIMRDIVPDFIHGFKEGYNDGFNQSHDVKTSGDAIPAVLSGSNVAGAVANEVKINDTYTLRNIKINADVVVPDNANTTAWITILDVILVFTIAISLIMVAYNINMAIVNIANGNVFDNICIRHIQRTGLLLLGYCIADVVYHRVCIAELRSIIHAPLQVVNTTTFNFQVLICAILAFIIAEAFKQGAALKAEQDLTI